MAIRIDENFKNSPAAVWIGEQSERFKAGAPKLKF